MLEGWQTGPQEENGLPWRANPQRIHSVVEGPRGVLNNIRLGGVPAKDSSKSTLWMRLRWAPRVFALAKVALAHVQTWGRSAASEWLKHVGPALPLGAHGAPCCTWAKCTAIFCSQSSWGSRLGSTVTMYRLVS